METIKGLIKSLINGGIGAIVGAACCHWLYPWMVIAFQKFLGRCQGK